MKGKYNRCNLSRLNNCYNALLLVGCYCFVFQSLSFDVSICIHLYLGFDYSVRRGKLVEILNCNHYLMVLYNIETLGVFRS